jgi:light-regulated signal transduction histidine kinase (bacteriophytochrome)
MSTIQRESDRQNTAVAGSVRLCEGMVFDTSPLAGVLRDHRPLVLALVSTPEQEKLWNHLIRLSIARGLVEAHGGRLLVRSVLGQGCTFVVWLPLEV